MAIIAEFGVVDWRSGNIPDLSRLGGVAVGSNLGRTLAACGGGKSLCVYTGLCMGFGVHTALINLHPVSGSVEDGFELCRMYGS